jgi:hypothetical protein
MANNIRGAAVRAIPTVQRALQTAEERIKNAHAQAVAAQQANSQRKLAAKAAEASATREGAERT